MMTYTSYITLKDGAEVTMTSNNALALERVEKALEANGFKYNDKVETWDEGFYDSTPVSS